MRTELLRLLAGALLLLVPASCSASEPQIPRQGSASPPPAVVPTRPNLSGQWVLQHDPARPMSSNTAFCRDACTIEHDDRELVVRFPANVTTYAVDGSVARSTSRVGGDAIELLTSAAWAGDAIAITRTARNMRTGAEIDRSIRVSMKDDAMVIEAVSRNGQGERQVYRRRPSP